MLNKRNLREFFSITIGTAIVAAAVYFFMYPSRVTVGSAAGLALVISEFVPLSASMVTMIMNVGLLVIGFLLIGPEFGLKTVYCAVLLPAFIFVFEILFPDFQSITGDPLIDVACYITLVGVGLSRLFIANASSGGLDIVAKLLNKFFHIDLGRAMATSGLLVALCSAFCYDKKTVVLSVLATYFGGIVLDHFIFGLDIKRKVCILSPKYDEITKFILHELHSGASHYDLIGAYDGSVRREIVTIVDKQEYRKLMDYVHKADPKAFVTVYAVNEVRYQPKK